MINYTTINNTMRGKMLAYLSDCEAGDWAERMTFGEFLRDQGWSTPTKYDACDYEDIYSLIYR